MRQLNPLSYLRLILVLSFLPRLDPLSFLFHKDSIPSLFVNLYCLQQRRYVVGTDISEVRIALSSGSSNVARLRVMELLDPEDEGNTIV